MALGLKNRNVDVSADASSSTSRQPSPEVQDARDDRDDVAVRSVPRKYRGTNRDQLEMMMLGKKQVLRRNFRFITMLGFGSTVICSWEVLLPTYTFVLTDGGMGDLFWGFLAVAAGMLLVYASLAEMTSMCPTAGGQYHWVSEFAPPKYQKPLSYLTGWLCATGWQVFLASVAFMVGGIIQGLIALNHASYPKGHNWVITPLTIGVMIFAVTFNTLLAVRLPLVEGIVLILHIAGFFAIFIPLWVLAPRAKPGILLEFSNNGGWPTTGIAAMIGLTTPLTALIGYDCSVHMSEELNDASYTMPRSIMWTVGPNATLGFLMAVTLVFTTGDIDSILGTKTNQPFIQVFYNGTRSLVATNVMVSIVVVCLTSCCISEVATASRQLWSFARDNGLPGSSWLAHVSPGWNIPLRAVLVSFVITTLLSCINLGSTEALNAINSLGGVSVLSSYFITISCLVWRRLYGEPLPSRRWSLGRYGLWINLAALIFLVPLWFFSFWPLLTPATTANMNWNSTMFGGVLIVSAIYYAVWGRKVYTGPVVFVKRNDMQ